MSTIQKQLIDINNKISIAAKNSNRDTTSITLVAVTKGQTNIEIQHAIDAGQLIFGENYLKEALPKIETFAGKNITWHYIGPIQSNKAKAIAKNFSWVQSVDSERIAILLNQHRPKELPKLNVCIEININDEKSKAGIEPKDVINLAHKIQTLQNLKLRGLMAIPAHSTNYPEQKNTFSKLHKIFNELNEQGFYLDTLSMGMSGDFEAAISEGSTMVRIGRAIFKR